jgi:hypothetical protein
MANAKELAWVETHPNEYKATTPVGFTYHVRRPRHQEDMPKQWQLIWVWYNSKGEFSKSLLFKNEQQAKDYAQLHFGDVVKSCINAK